MTTVEYLETPETVQPRELIYGELHVADAPTVTHQRLVGRLFKALDEHVGTHKLGEVLLSPIDVILDGPKALVVQPDLVFVSAARATIVEDRIWARRIWRWKSSRHGRALAGPRSASRSSRSTACRSAGSCSR